MAEEIALFIDFENIRYSMLNTQHREPDPQELINVARRYGTVMVAKAYADWTRQPEMFKGSLMAAMIDRVDCPAKQRDRFRGNGWQAPGTGQSTNGWNAHREEANATSNWNASSTTLNVDETIDEEEDEETENTDVNPVESISESSSMARGSSSATPWMAPSQPPQYGTQSTVDLNMLMDIIETVFDRPTISTFVLMTGDRDFTRICARLKLRLNKFVVVAGVPGTVSRDLTAAANQFVLIGNHSNFGFPPQTQHFGAQAANVTPTDPQFIQFLDYIDRHWAWRTIIGVSNFIGDPYNHKNRFRGRLTRESARELLQTCIQQGILTISSDDMGNEDLRLNRANPAVETILIANQQQAAMGQSQPGMGPGPYSQMGPWTQRGYSTGTGLFDRRNGSAIPLLGEEGDEIVDEDDEDLIEDDMDEDMDLVDENDEDDSAND